jgi:hypothetical protein
MAGAVYKHDLNVTNGILTGGKEKLFSFLGERYSFEKGVSPDSNQYFLVCEYHNSKDKNESYAGVIMDKQMNVVSKFSFTMAEERDDVLSTEYKLLDNGVLLLISALKQKSPKGTYTPVQYNIRQIEKEGKSQTSVLSGVPEGLFDNIIWKTVSNQLSFTGFLSKGKKADFTSMITGVFDLEQKKTSVVKETELNKIPFLQNATEPYLKEIAKGGIPTLTKVVTSFRNADQSSYLVLEENSSKFHDNYGSYMAAGGAFGTQSRFSSGTNYNSGNVFIIKLTQSNDIEWIKLIGKNQVQPLSDAYTSVAYIKDAKEGIHFFFNDQSGNEQAEPQKNNRMAILQSKLNNTSLASVYITKDGKVSKQFIQNNESTDHFFSPRDFSLAGSNQIIYTAYRYRNLGRSSYRIGAIMIK